MTHHWQPAPATTGQRTRLHVARGADTELARRDDLVEQEAPEGGRAAGRWLLRVLFAATLVTSVALWWFNNPAGPMESDSTAAILAAGGRITGLLGGYTLLIQVLLMSRVGWLERWIGAHEHDDLAPRHSAAAVLALVLSHVALASSSATPRLGASVPLRRRASHDHHVPGTCSAHYVATGILVAVALLAIRAIRRRMPLRALVLPAPDQPTWSLLLGLRPPVRRRAAAGRAGFGRVVLDRAVRLRPRLPGLGPGGRARWCSTCATGSASPTWCAEGADIVSLYIVRPTPAGPAGPGRAVLPLAVPDPRRAGGRRTRSRCRPRPTASGCG